MQAKNIRLRYLLWCFLALLALCARADAEGVSSNSDAASKPSEYPLLKLERFRGGCRACPAYEVVVHSDGGVTYVGKDFVNVLGVQRARLKTVQLKSLVAAVEALRIESLQSSYVEPGWPDSGIVSLNFWQGGKQVSVRFQPYVGSGPVALREFAKLIDSTVGTRKWICPVPQFNEIVCPKE